MMEVGTPFVLKSPSPLAAQTLTDLSAHAVAEFPREACGVVCIIKGRERYVSCRNIAADPENRFSISPEDFADAEDRGQIIAIVHSHPKTTARPSPADLVGCEQSGVPWHIVPVGIPEGQSLPVAGALFSYEPNGYKAPLVGRPFVHGVLDCYALVRDYYDQVLNIKLIDPPREDHWWANGGDLYMEQFASAGFVRTKGISDLQVGDGILMQVRSPVVNHAAIYLGDGLILHHFYNRLSSRDVYGGQWQEMTRLIVRHKDLNHV